MSSSLSLHDSISLHINQLLRSDLFEFRAHLVLFCHGIESACKNLEGDWTRTRIEDNIPTFASIVNRIKGYRDQMYQTVLRMYACFITLICENGTMEKNGYYFSKEQCIVMEAVLLNFNFTVKASGFVEENKELIKKVIVASIEKIIFERVGKALFSVLLHVNHERDMKFKEKVEYLKNAQPYHFGIGVSDSELVRRAHNVSKDFKGVVIGLSPRSCTAETFLEVQIERSRSPGRSIFSPEESPLFSPIDRNRTFALDFPEVSSLSTTNAFSKRRQRISHDIPKSRIHPVNKKFGVAASSNFVREKFGVHLVTALFHVVQDYRDCIDALENLTSSYVPREKLRLLVEVSNCLNELSPSSSMYIIFFNFLIWKEYG